MMTTASSQESAATGGGSMTVRAGVRKVLIVEDDEAMAAALHHGFETEGFEVTTAADGLEALEQARSGCPEIVILDVMLPRLSGLDVCKRLRSEGDDVPVIMLTARGQEIDKIVGLKLGADDYVTKPFSFMELLARVEAVLRRSAGRAAERCERYRLGDVVIDFKRHEASKGGEPIELTPREFRLLEYFIAHRGEVVTREELLDAVWGYNAIPFTRPVDTHVAKLRKKIEDQPSDPHHLVTVHRLGYKLTG